MTVEYLGQGYSSTNRGCGEIWSPEAVLTAFYAVSIDRTGFWLPVWSGKERGR